MLIIVFLVISLVKIFAQDQDQQAESLSKDDNEIIQNLETLQEFEVLANMDLSENYGAVKEMKSPAFQGEANEKNSD